MDGRVIPQLDLHRCELCAPLVDHVAQVVRRPVRLDQLATAGSRQTPQQRRVGRRGRSLEGGRIDHEVPTLRGPAVLAAGRHAAHPVHACRQIRGVTGVVAARLARQQLDLTRREWLIVTG